MARISPIHKKGSKTEPGNYQPVSVLPVISKFIERIFLNQLYSYLIQNYLICEQQTGFRKKHFCQTSLHRLNEQLLSDLHAGKVVGLVALDLKKAFDTANHKILFEKLNFYGIQNTKHMWFISYSQERVQYCTGVHPRIPAIRCVRQ